MAGRVLVLTPFGWAAAAVKVACTLAAAIGRVIPMFTNSLAGARATSRAWLEKAVPGSTLALLLADALRLRGTGLVALTGLCATAHFARWTLWQPWNTLRTPLVWVLHVAYLWIAVHLGLRALAELGWIGTSSATHALTVGAIGGLVIGMMTRTALGHTGRPLKAGRAEVACYLLVLAAALVSAVLVSAGFALYAAAYWPVLTQARVDGKPG